MPSTRALPMPELAPYAVSEVNSRGRRQTDTTTVHRSEFQRDRDRIVHSSAFRRLEYKTQVFVNHEGDLFRTRLTHSIEVAQIGRSIARALRLNEDLVEAISLAHDLGHTPFGHAGQEALHRCMREHGGFEHNLQSLRIVDLLEQRYAAFDGLNLCFETREGIIKHCSLENARPLGELGERFFTRSQPSLEAQICNLADEIAYNNHDVDDGLRAGLISLQQLEEVNLFARYVDEVRRLYPSLSERRLIHETVRRMINALVCDLIENSAANIASQSPLTVEEVRRAPPLIAFSADFGRAQQEMKRFLRCHLYQHYQVLRMANKARHIIDDLFTTFGNNPALLPPQYLADDSSDQIRRVADYIAGMTDRYAIKEHQRLFAVGES